MSPYFIKQLSFTPTHVEIKQLMEEEIKAGETEEKTTMNQISDKMLLLLP
jgi:hypothetical protein